MPVPAHRPAGLRDARARVRARPAVRGAEVAEALHLVVPRPRRLPRGGDQRDRRSPRRGVAPRFLRLTARFNVRGGIYTTRCRRAPTAPGWQRAPTGHAALSAPGRRRARSPLRCGNVPPNATFRAHLYSPARAGIIARSSNDRRPCQERAMPAKKTCAEVRQGQEGAAPARGAPRAARTSAVRPAASRKAVAATHARKPAVKPAQQGRAHRQARAPPPQRRRSAQQRAQRHGRRPASRSAPPRRRRRPRTAARAGRRRRRRRRAGQPARRSAQRTSPTSSSAASST